MRIKTKSTGWPTEPIPVDIEGDMSFEDMLMRSKEILRREITHLMHESVQGKLDPDSAKDLVQYVKILKDLTKQESEQAEALSKEELEAALEKKT